jgi:histidinol phosphatase-like enzyme
MCYNVKIKDNYPLGTFVCKFMKPKFRMINDWFRNDQCDMDDKVNCIKEWSIKSIL